MKFLSAITLICAILGIIFTFINPIVSIICASICIIHSICNVIFGDQNNLSSEIMTVIGAVIIALIFDFNILNTICFFICLAEFILRIVSVIVAEQTKGKWR